MTDVTVMPGPKNAWRLSAGAGPTWAERLKPVDPGKFFIVSCDNHVNEPPEVFDGIDAKFRERIPTIKTDADGTQWLITEGWAPQPVRIATSRTDLMPPLEEFETWDLTNPFSNRMEDQDIYRSRCGRSVKQRMADRASQGIDAEIIFSTRGLLAFATPDVEFSIAMARTWNRWALEHFQSDFQCSLPMALVATGHVEEAIKDVQWAASNGFHGIMIPNRPIFHRVNEPKNPLEYNDKVFDPLWAAIEESGLPITLHVGTGQDPRAVRGNGGALTNFVCHANSTTVEPIVQLIASGVFERHPKLKAGTIESGVGWIPWVINQLDHGYRAHHMWIRPVLPRLPSEYFKQNCFATFMEEGSMVSHCLSLGLENNMVWASDYPHPEGSFPHCAESISRVLSDVPEEQAAKLLGLNAARIFNIQK
jgi:predicted TIM-barrel fold metal-dependent hydrolase